jgi:hypothetical protein
MGFSCLPARAADSYTCACTASSRMVFESDAGSEMPISVVPMSDCVRVVTLDSSAEPDCDGPNSASRSCTGLRGDAHRSCNSHAVGESHVRDGMCVCQRGCAWVCASCVIVHTMDNGCRDSSCKQQSDRRLKR